MPSQFWLAPIATAHKSGSALTASATPTSLLPDGAQPKLPADFWRSGIGTMLELEAWGKISCAVTSPGTAQFTVRFGSIVVFDGVAVPLNIIAQTDVGWNLRISLMLLSVGTGTAATLRGAGTFTSGATIGAPAVGVAAPGSFLLPYNTAPGSAGNGFDSTTSQLVDLFHTQTVGSGSITLQQFMLRG